MTAQNITKDERAILIQTPWLEAKVFHCGTS